MVQETLQTLRHAYPEGNAPPEIQTLIEKYEQESAKSVTKAIHTATNSLSRAQRQLNETLEARKKHRASWMSYLAESVKTWESQLDGYKKQQAAFYESAAKARGEIQEARIAINLWNTKAATGAGSAVPTQPISELAEDPKWDDTEDKEEEQLRDKLQSVLTECAAALGMPVVDKPKTDIMDVSSEGEGDKPEKKRPRSIDPGASRGLTS